MDNNELGKILNNICLLHQTSTKNGSEWKDFEGRRNTSHYYSTLIILKERGKLPLSEIGESICIKRQNMTNIADALVEKGLVIRVPSSKDRRVIKLSITDKGEECLKHWQKDKIRMINKVLECFNDEEIEKFSLHLKKLNNTLRLDD
jgi:DNA-binding MarR family transcriptional regulator